MLTPESHRQTSTGWSSRLHHGGGKVGMSLLGLPQCSWKLWPPGIRGETALPRGVLVGTAKGAQTSCMSCCLFRGPLGLLVGTVLAKGMCQVDWDTARPDTWSSLIPDESVRAFLSEIDISVR